MDWPISAMKAFRPGDVVDRRKGKIFKIDAQPIARRSPAKIGIGLDQGRPVLAEYDGRRHPAAQFRPGLQRGSKLVHRVAGRQNETFDRIQFDAGIGQPAGCLPTQTGIGNQRRHRHPVIGLVNKQADRRAIQFGGDRDDFGADASKTVKWSSDNGSMASPPFRQCPVILHQAWACDLVSAPTWRRSSRVKVCET